MTWAVRRWLCAGFLTLVPSGSFASHWSVDSGGGADFVAIQPALLAGGRDSILVAGGSYPETLSFAGNTPSVALVGLAGGPAVTIRTMTLQPGGSSPAWSVNGLTLSEPLWLNAIGVDAKRFQFRRCAFLQGAYSRVESDGGGNFQDCDFHGPSAFVNYGNSGAFTALRFHSARLYVSPSGTGPVVMSGCSFEGPGDTLVAAHASSGDNGLIFRECVFRDAGHGIVFSLSSDVWSEIERCVFEDLSAAAIRYEPGVAPQCGNHACLMDQGVIVNDSRFERCGQAMRWLTVAPSRVFMTRDTVLASTGVAIEVSPSMNLNPLAPSFTNLLVDGGASHGLSARLAGNFSTLWVKDSRFTHLAGDGVRIVLENPPQTYYGSRVSNCISSQNSGDGFHVEGTGIALTRNVAFDNGGDGIDYTSTAAPDPTWPFAPAADSVVLNTCARNQADGIRVVRATGLQGISQVVQRNISAANGTAGVRGGNASAMSLAFNDAWLNYLGDYVGSATPQDSNLVVDPQFCDMASGQLGLQQGSPCSSAGPYGALGALPVSCPSVASVAEGSFARRLMIAPNPSRGSVTFTLPSARSGVLEVFDPQGRVVWRRSIRAGEPAIWDGLGQAARMGPGSYVARIRDDGGCATARFVRVR